MHVCWHAKPDGLKKAVWWMIDTVLYCFVLLLWSVSSFRLTLPAPQQPSPSCKMTGSLANFLLMTRNCHSDDESSGHLNSCQIAWFRIWKGLVSLRGIFCAFHLVTRASWPVMKQIRKFGRGKVLWNDSQRCCNRWAEKGKDFFVSRYVECIHQKRKFGMRKKREVY